VTSVLHAESSRRMAPAKGRILAAATALFAAEGIRSVGVDRLIQQSSVTKATFYKHFGSKDRLIHDYLQAASVSNIAELDDIVESASSARSALYAIADAVRDFLLKDDFRGSLFINAAAEFPDPRSAVRLVVTDHHEAIAERFTQLLQRLEHPLAGEASDELMLAYVGAFSWGHVGDPIGASVAFRRAIDRIIADASPAA